VSDSSKKETLSLSGDARPLTLRRSVESSQVKQNFSHGRSKTVQVEVRKKRTAARATSPAPVEEEVVVQKPEPAAPPPPPPPSEQPEEPRIRHVLPTLSESEKAARARALEDAQRADAAARHQAEEQARLRQMEEKRAQAEREAADLRRKAELDRKRIEEEARRRAEEEAERKLREQEGRGDEDAAAAPQAEKSPIGAQVSGRDLAEREALESEGGSRGRRVVGRKVPSPRRSEPRRRAGRLTIAQALDVDETDERVRSLASVRRERERQRQLRAEWAASGTTQRIVREVVIPESITVQELANRMAERSTDVIRALMKMGLMVTITQSIDADTAELVVNEFGHRPKRVSAADVEIGLEGVEDREADLRSRPPVVTVMGHVDHGKTSLLDALRETDVAGREAGGITQHIGAYQVDTGGGRITFLDTPGHEAFTAMRARGAKATDIVVLVVAADDGVMPQTIEAINHAKAAAVPIIVAVNKIDRPDADPARVKRELLQHEVVPEEMGGDVQVIEVSATQKTNLDKLDEAILLQAEVLELTANPDRAAEGIVVEAKLDRGRGPIATVLVQRGTLRTGDIFVAGTEWGRVRALLDSHGDNVEAAGPSVPVEVLGLGGTPQAGDSFVVVENEARARDVADYRTRILRDERVAVAPRGTLEQMFEQIQGGEIKVVPVVIKADVQGSVEAIVGALENLSTGEVAVRVLHSAVGGITESDITLANASKALVIGFNVRANVQARDMARQSGIEIRYYQIIYELVDDIKAALSGLLAPERRETVIGAAEVLEVFSISKVGRIAGSRVTSGVVRRNARARLLRDSVVVHDGPVKSLRRFKDDVREVREGNECGIALENYQDYRPGDTIEFYEVEEIERSL
jgi:translation initiation factor IF-2